MEIIPVIEVRSGKSIRSTFVRSDQPGIVRDDVLLIAKRWKDEGATRLHIHDTDGVRVGMPQNRDQVRDIVRRIGLPVQFSGGVRTPEVMERVLGWGVDRVIADTEVTLDLAARPTVARFAGAAALELQVHNGRIPHPHAAKLAHPVATAGHHGAWVDAFDFLRDMNQNVGWARYLCRVSLGDGGLAAPLQEDIEKFIRQARKPVCVYAKFRTWEELRAVHKCRPESILVGEALYDGALSLPDLIHWAKNADNVPEKSTQIKPWMPGYKPGAPTGAGLANGNAPVIGTPRPAVPAPPARAGAPRPPIPPLPPKR